MAALILVPVAMVAVEIDFDALKGKAERFYRHQEWASALAMYELMLMRKPADVPTYSHAITVNGVLDKPDSQLRLIEQTQQNGIALDTLFGLVKKEAFALGEPAVYERMLTMVKTHQPWLKRGIDLKLLQYYDSRNNAPLMVSLADTLLMASPSDVGILQVKARGYMLQNDFARATLVYDKILEIEPDNLDVNINQGVYCYAEVERRRLTRNSPEAVKALKCLEKAYSIKATPYLKELIGKLKRNDRKP